MENDNKNVFAKNLKNQMAIHGKSRKDISDALGISYFTVSDWVNGKKYPRMDKVELLAIYFGILKSDLIEEKGDNNALPSKTITLSEGEETLVELFRLVPAEQQEMVLDMIRVALNRKQ